MKNTIIPLGLLLCLIQGTWAQEPALSPLVRATQHSGFVRPVDRFTIQCQVSNEGRLHSEILSDFSSGQWADREVVDRDLTPEERVWLPSWIQASAEGPYDQGQNPCDIGGISISVRRGDAMAVILDSQDCGARTANQSPSAKKLAEWVKKECKLR